MMPGNVLTTVHRNQLVIKHEKKYEFLDYWVKNHKYGSENAIDGLD
jgi:hypothetical protein